MLTCAISVRASLGGGRFMVLEIVVEKVDVEFTLTNEWARRTYTGFCALTGLPFIVRTAE